MSVRKAMTVLGMLLVVAACKEKEEPTGPENGNDPEEEVEEFLTPRPIEAR